MQKADIKIGYSCNNNCIHCVIAGQREPAIKHRGNQDRSTAEYIQELEESRSGGCDFIVFTGGEPTIRKDLPYLLEYAKKIGYEIAMQTNGRMFYYKDYAEKICSIANIRYVIAIHGADGDTHDKITQAKNSFDQTIQGIKNLIRLKQIITGKTVISKKNYRQLPEIARIFMKLGVKNMNFAFPHAEGNAWKYFDDVVPTYTEIEPYIKETIKTVEEQGEDIILRFETIPYCFMEGYEKYAVENEYQNTERTELKNLIGKPIDWDIIRKQIKQKFPQCSECKYGNICEGPWKEYSKKYGIEEFKSVK